MKRAVQRAIVAAAIGAITLEPALAMSNQCFTHAEWRAANVQALNRQLEVAALECSKVAGHSYDQQYKDFVDKFHKRLKADGMLFQAHFRRIGGRAWQTQQDQFITKLANDVSERSMHSMTFCADAAPLFSAAMAVEEARLDDNAVLLITDHSLIGEECPVPASTKLHRRHKKPAAAAAAVHLE
jgi:hypothetical protein